MELFDNLYIVSVKNKHVLPAAVLFVIGMIAKGRRIEKEKTTETPYFGDNVPLDLAERIRNA